MPTFSIHLLSDSAITAKKDRFFTSRNCIYATVAQTSQGHRTKGETKPCPFIAVSKIRIPSLELSYQRFLGEGRPDFVKAEANGEVICTLDREADTNFERSIPRKSAITPLAKILRAKTLKPEGMLIATTMTALWGGVFISLGMCFVVHCIHG